MTQEIFIFSLLYKRGKMGISAHLTGFALKSQEIHIFSKTITDLKKKIVLMRNQ